MFWQFATKVKTFIVQSAKAIWCHRVTYAGLALAYGAGCMVWVYKKTVAQLATALYVALTAQRH